MSNRAMIIAIMLALAALMGYIVLERFFRSDVVVEMAPVAEVLPSKKQPGVRARMSSCERIHDRTQLRGYVENTGNTDLSFVTVTAMWKDMNGLVIESAIIYAVRDLALAPGERREFEASSEKNRAARCNVELLDWWA
jgi:hypothetical protein